MDNSSFLTVWESYYRRINCSQKHYQTLYSMHHHVIMASSHLPRITECNYSIQYIIIVSMSTVHRKILFLQITQLSRLLLVIELNALVFLKLAIMNQSLWSAWSVVWIKVCIILQMTPSRRSRLLYV